MAKGSSYAAPATPSRGEGGADYDLTPAKDEDDYVDNELEAKAPVQEPDLHEGADMFVTKSGGVKSLSCNFADEFEEAGKPAPAHDDIDELNDDLKKPSTMTRSPSQHTTKKDGNRPPINGESPVVNKTLGQCLNAMMDTSIWIQLFAPKAARQAVWAELVEELSHPVNSTSTSQVAEDAVSFLMAMGMEAHAYPSSTALTTGSRRKHALSCSGGNGNSSLRLEARMLVLDDNRDEDNPFYQDDDENDATTELAWQIRELTAMQEMDPMPRFEIAQHRPLGKITPFRGSQDESENSMQWLRGFVYEMKSTHTPPNEWCMAIQSSLRDGAVHWHRALSRKTKRTWSLLSDKFISYYCSQFSQSASTRYYRAKRSEKEHIRDYLNRLNDYARSTNIKFERSGRAAKEHVKHFLETCGDLDLERQLSPMQLRDIHTLKDIVCDIQKVEKRVSIRSSSQIAVVVKREVAGDEADQDECDSDCGSNYEIQREDTYSDQGERLVAAPNDNEHNSQVDLVKVDSDVQLNLDRDSTITVVDAVSRDQQLHDFGKCEAFDELAKIDRTNVDKKNISPELQKLDFGGHLN
ncbi:hypothetical protein PHMEG_00024129 [Phytophthora megakarya]|uniref:Retrotransposon gag domain-containing protein n=1 Tax=Phytophthora megakarya TaxID=4795 RepID=A0A225VFG3_9STRA|nr:hypothetical protein PHMEG_00024129 [Phytophthora megakarya]